MVPQTLIDNAAVPVSSHKHADLSLKTGGEYGFARAVNAVPLTAVDLQAAAPEPGTGRGCRPTLSGSSVVT